MLAFGLVAAMAVGSGAQAQTQYTPSVLLSQRYDSNVYTTADKFVPQGHQSWDLITRLGADFDILNKSRLGDTSLHAAVDGNAYAYNSNLTYASTNVIAKSDLTDWAQEVLPGLQLRISDAFRFTPQQPSFSYAAATPQSGGVPQPSAGFTSGLQGARANSYANKVSTEGDYSFSRSAGLRANYSYSTIHYGRLYVPLAATNPTFNYWNTNIHNAAIGPTFTLDGGDTIFLKFAYLNSHQTNTAGTTPPRTFSAYSVQPEYVSKIFLDWTARISAGATIVEQQANKTFFSGNFSLTNDFDRQTRVSIEVSRQITPAFIAVGGAVVSNIAQLYVSHSFSQVISLTVRGGLAHNEATPVKVFTQEITNGIATLDYNLTRSIKLSLSQEYIHYNLSGVPNYDKLVTMLAASTEW